MTAPHSNTRRRPVIRVFVSSTFSDMKHERNALQEHVFPKLEQLCLQSGFQFQAIDLRWGVSTEAGLDHRTMRICFDELRRAQEISPRPNFLILLGNRYGWRPLPEEISIEEFHALECAAAQVQAASSTPAVAVLRDWYRRDDNAVPPVHVLQSRRQDLHDGRDYTDETVWNEVQAVLWAIINHAMPPDQLRGRFHDAVPEDEAPPIVRFQASATEQEIWHGALRVPDAHEHVLAFFREIGNIGGVTNPTAIKNFVDVGPPGGVDGGLQAEQERLKAELRERLGEPNVFEAKVALVVDPAKQPAAEVTTGHLEQLCADVERRLTEIIRQQIDEYWAQTTQASAERALRELKIEQDEHERFGRERGAEDSFVGRQAELQAILDYVQSDSPWPLVVHGASGCGKTSLLARASQEVAKTRPPIVRFIGVQPRSSDLRSLLSSLCQELRLRHPREDELPGDPKALREELDEHLRAAMPEQPLILFLDALDQLSDADSGRLLHWIPVGRLPAHVKLVVSCLSDRDEGDPAGQPYAELRRHGLPAESFINLDALLEAEARVVLFDRWLPQAGRMVNPVQRARIEQRLSSAACRQPIYLRLLFEEARLWRSYGSVPDLGEGVPALLGQLFARLSLPTNHGQLLVERVSGYLAASREGLAENEILEILFADPEYSMALARTTKDTLHEMPSHATRIPIAIWSRLRFDLSSYLAERSAAGANVLTFYHRQVAEWVREQFARAPDQGWQPHLLLAEYFHKLADPERDGSWRCGRMRPFRELPFQLERAGQRLRTLWFDTLGQLQFAQAKCEMQLAYDLVSDLDAALRESRGAAHSHRLCQLRDAVWSQAGDLERVPSLSRQQVALRVLDYVSPDMELASHAKLFFEHVSAAESGWAYPFLPEHAMPSAEQVELPNLPHVRAVVPYNEHAIAFCDGRRWFEVDDNGATVREGTLPQECHIAAGGGGRIAAAVGKYGFVWNEWPVGQPHAHFVATDEVTLLVWSGRGDRVLAASRDGAWSVLSRGPGERWTLSGRSQSPARVLAAAAIEGKRWALVTADKRLHVGSGQEWQSVVLPCEGLTAACFDDVGLWVAVSHGGMVSVFDLTGHAIQVLSDVARDLKVVRSVPGNCVLATTEDGTIHRCSLTGASRPVPLVTSQHQCHSITVLEGGHRAVATDYVGKARLFSTNLPAPELAVRGLPVREVVRTVRLDDVYPTMQGVDSTGARFAIEASGSGWSASTLQPLSTHVAQAWFRDTDTLVTTEDFNAASSLYEHQLGEAGGVHTRLVWPAPTAAEPYRSFSFGGISGGGKALAVSIRRAERGGNELLVFDAHNWRIISRVSFEEDNAVDQVVPDDSGDLVLVNHVKVRSPLNLLRHGRIESLPIAGGVLRSAAHWSPPMGDLDLSADGSRFISILSSGTAYLVLTNHPEDKNRVALGNGVRWCRFSSCGELALLGRGDREVEVMDVTSLRSVRSICRFFAPFRIDWAGVHPAQRVVLVAGKGALWGCRFHWKRETQSQTTVQDIQKHEIGA
ncbi:AAA family ATPase [Planctomycetota bacterium]